MMLSVLPAALAYLLPMQTPTLPVASRAHAAAVATPLSAAPRRCALLRMQGDFYDEYVETDPKTGEQKTLTLGEKEKLYLDCLDSFYNEGGKQLLSNDEYEKLQLDLDFEGSKVGAMTKDEIKFMIANKRFSMGKPILSDEQYNALRETLRAAGSLVVLHDAASCNVETGICKSDIRVDNAKTRLLYVPGTVGSLVALCELSYWTLHLDPILSIVLSAVPSYFAGKWFTENIFAQDPLVTTAVCPSCGVLLPVYFGDLFSVETDGLVKGVPKPPQAQYEFTCASCKDPLRADRDKMLLSTIEPKGK